MLLLLLLCCTVMGKMGRMVQLVMMVMEIVRYERQFHRCARRARSSHHGAVRRCHRTIAGPVAEATGQAGCGAAEQGTVLRTHARTVLRAVLLQIGQRTD
uniref:Putative secreted protein n=1 Tax=Anopheles triannulatus TaxID=58253 RepID=A0A2M4B5R4_9DIPT